MRVNILESSSTLQYAANIFARYGQKNPYIQRILFFGSRVTGKQRIKKLKKESDLDIAIEFITSCEEQIKWNELKLCKELLQPNFLFDLDIELYDEGTPFIRNYLNAGCISVYEKQEECL